MQTQLNHGAWCSIYAFRSSIFEWTAKLQPLARGEYELTDAIRALELKGDWADVRYPEILAQLNKVT